MLVVILRYVLVSYLFLFQCVMAEEPLPAAIKAFEKQGMRIVGRFDAPNGMQGYAAEYQKQGITLYASRDGKFVISGYLYDAKGNNLSLKPLNELVYAPMAKQVWSKLQKSTWIADGQANAPKIIYMFSDPNCPYCNRFWQQARPWVDSGKVQIRHILVGILSHDSPTKAAALLTMKDPAKGLLEYEKSQGKNGLKPLDPIPAAIQKKLDDNQLLMDELGSVATPTLLYFDDNGHLQQQQGMPEQNELSKVLGQLN
ncbi:thiol:disulfide interchange protein DsbG [Tolumonas lignilytica]|uniref:thiol:disulfide interchange protein DsbG n=1 Tax=Tolumonas lignilytica TaxID=1283284 RepID=UPI0006864D2B|nr:thiol:disulfide interchange protein DsbG [Tolumonas lignilytica]